MSRRPQINRDYKYLPPQEEANEYASTTHRFWVMTSLSFLLLAGTIFLYTINSFSFQPLKTSYNEQVPRPAVQNQRTQSPAADTKISLPLVIPRASQSGAPVETTESFYQQWQNVKVRRGDNLAKIFSRLKLSPKLLHDIVNSSTKAKRLKNIKPGQTIRFLFNDREFVSLTLELSKTRQLRVDRDNNGFITTLHERSPEARTAHAVGTIDSSLYLAAKDADLSDNLIMGLANIFGWDIDFALDIRKGDSFIVAYEELYLDGEKIRDGNIIAAEFINNNKTFRAVRYTDPDNNTGYYTPDGRNMRKDFLRTPVDFTRISSRFGKRYHPVLNRMRSHNGVDYAAQRGTPIRATGDGKIIFKGRKGGYGRTIIIQHGSGKRTLYAHMSSYKRGIRKNKRVKQGQTIGFVGSSGLATGPHLHYEFRINGVHRNPLRIKFASAAPIAKKYRDDFNYKTGGYSALLDVLGKTSIALTETSGAPLRR